MKKSFELTVIVGEIKDDKIVNQKSFTGIHNKIVDFMNEEYSKRFLRLKNDKLIVFNINPETQEDLEENWFTLQQLVRSGLIELEE